MRIGERGLDFVQAKNLADERVERICSSWPIEKIERCRQIKGGIIVNAANGDQAAHDAFGIKRNVLGGQHGPREDHGAADAHVGQPRSTVCGTPASSAQIGAAACGGVKHANGKFAAQRRKGASRRMLFHSRRAALGSLTATTAAPPLRAMGRR